MKSRPSTKPPTSTSRNDGAVCRACGDCCVSWSIDLEKGDLRPNGVPEEYVDREGCPRMKMVPGGQGMPPRCAALGPRNRCRIYERRPAACRKFLCKAAGGQEDPPVRQAMLGRRCVEAMLHRREVKRQQRAARWKADRRAGA